MGLDRTIGLEIGEGNHFAVYLPTTDITPVQ